MIRIISGTAKGRRLQAPKNLPVRPTTDRAKEALFNILQHQHDLPSSHVLDLFSGTGNISYEFASRGVAHSTAVEQHRKCVEFIRSTNDLLGFSIDVVQQEVLHFLAQTQNKYSLIFADPPYDWEIKHYEDLLDIAMQRLENEGLLIVEHEKHKGFEKHPNWLESRHYGSCSFSFFKQ